MNEPDDEAGRSSQPEPVFEKGERDAPPEPMSEEAARGIGSWSRTIRRWTSAGERCVFISEEGVRPAALEDVADAIERLRKRPQSPPE